MDKNAFFDRSASEARIRRHRQARTTRAGLSRSLSLCVRSLDVNYTGVT